MKVCVCGGGGVLQITMYFHDSKVGVILKGMPHEILKTVNLFLGKVKLEFQRKILNL